MNVIDHRKDKDLTFVQQFVGNQRLLPSFAQGLTKVASIPEHAYAWKEAELFPVHTPEDALLSWVYAVKQAEHVPQPVLKKIAEVATVFGFDIATLREVADEVQSSEPTVKEAAEEEYLLPQYRRLQVKTAGDAMMAADTLCSQSYQLRPETLAEASVRLVKKAAALDMPTTALPTKIFKYAGMTLCDAGLLLDWLDARASAATHPTHREMYEKIATTVEQQFPRTGLLRQRDELVKIASTIAEADNMAGLRVHYGHRLLDPLETVFNTDKLASTTIDLAGTPVLKSKLLGMEPEFFGDVLGQDFVDEIKGPDGNVDERMLLTVLETLPDDMKKALATAAGPYLT